MNVLYSEDVAAWDGVRLPMQIIQNVKWTELNLMDQEYTQAIKEKSIQLGRILDANYKKADLEQEVNKLIQLTKFQQVLLLSCLILYEDIFNGNLGEWTGPPVDITLKGKTTTYHEHAFPIPVIHL